MKLQIVPALDVLDGSVVRLLKGDYDAVTTYKSEPARALTEWADQGAELVHVVDLAGARSGAPTSGLLADLAATGVDFQIGGGIRDIGSASAALSGGATRVVLGSAAVWQPGVLEQIVAEFGADRVVAAVDVRSGKATGEGWLDEGRPVSDVLEAMSSVGVGWVLVTGIARDGTMEGPDLKLTAQAVESVPSAGVIGSGGIGTCDDIAAVAGVGAAALVIGRAFYEGAFSFAEAVEASNG